MGSPQAWAGADEPNGGLVGEEKPSKPGGRDVGLATSYPGQSKKRGSKSNIVPMTYSPSFSSERVQSPESPTTLSLYGGSCGGSGGSPDDPACRRSSSGGSGFGPLPFDKEASVFSVGSSTRCSSRGSSNNGSGRSLNGSGGDSSDSVGHMNGDATEVVIESTSKDEAAHRLDTYRESPAVGIECGFGGSGGSPSHECGSRKPSSGGSGS